MLTALRLVMNCLYPFNMVQLLVGHVEPPMPRSVFPKPARLYGKVDVSPANMQAIFGGSMTGEVTGCRSLMQFRARQIAQMCDGLSVLLEQVQSPC